MRVSTPNSLDRAVREALDRAGLRSGCVIVVAVSGGPDSLALINSMNRAARGGRARLYGAHLDHRLRGEAARSDARFVAGVFRSLGIEATLDEADVPAYRKERRLSVEDAARRLRYDFLGRVAAERQADAVALGHTSDDQAETVLIHLIRGSGLTGLAGMREAAARRLAGRSLLLLRPLLTVSRQETEAYCRALGLEPRQDETNLLTDFTRNRLRADLIPLLERYNPAVKDALVRLSRSAALDADHLDEEVSRVLPDVGRMDESRGLFTIDRQGFAQLPPPLRSRLLRRAFREVRGSLENLGQAHVDAMTKLIAGPAGRSLDLPAGLAFDVDYESAAIGPRGADRCPLPPIDGEKRLAVPGETRVGGWTVSTSVVDSLGEWEARTRRADRGGGGLVHEAALSAASTGRRLCVRSRRPGDRFHPLGMPQAKKLQDFMVDSRVPRSWRDRVPLVVAPGGIAWVVGWRPAEWARIRNGDAPALLITFRRQDQMRIPRS